MHDGMPYDPIQGQGHETFKVRNSWVIGITADKTRIIFVSPATRLTYSVHCCHFDFAK